jgi:hypothetical protein
MTDDTSQDQDPAPAEADDLEFPDEQADELRGGKPLSPPGGAQPIPYPN